MFIFHKNVTSKLMILLPATLRIAAPQLHPFLVVLQPAQSPSELSQPGAYTLNSLTDTNAS